MSEPTTTSEPSAAPSGLEWLATYAAALGTTAPDESTITTLLDLAGTAAHASERIAAPIACYLVGCVGMPPADALALARSLSEP